MDVVRFRGSSMPLGNWLGDLEMSKTTLTGFYARMQVSAKRTALILFGVEKPVYTWSGVHFGRRESNILVTRNGVEAGQFYGEEVYSREGYYLGELKDERLVTHRAKTGKRWVPFAPQSRRACLTQENLRERPLYMGYADFPYPQMFEQGQRTSAA
jgi:hypothetical protein